MLGFFFKQEAAYVIGACLVGSEMCVRDSGGVLVIGLGEVTDWKCANLKRVMNDEVQAYVKCS